MGTSRTTVIGAATRVAELQAGETRSTDTLIIDTSTPWARWCRDLLMYRGALYSLAWRNVRSRYKQAALGISWAVVQPLVQTGVFTVFFGILAGIPSGDVPYPAFALAGLVPWNLFQKVTTEGAASLVTNQNLITKLYFPRIYLVLASGASALIDAAVGIALLVALMIWYSLAPGLAVLVAIPALLGVALLAFGTAALLGSLNARWRDIQHAVPFALQVGLFVTPVIYQSSFVPERWQWILALNPLTGLLEVFRSATLGVPLPAAHVLLLSGTVSILMVVFGVWQFTRSEATIVDVV